MQPSLEWVRHLKTDKEKKEFFELLLSSRQVLGRLLELIHEKQSQIEKAEIDPSKYDSGYAFFQAHLNGKRSGLTEIEKLVEFIEQNSKGRP